jgi:hypothetical protein
MKTYVKVASLILLIFLVGFGMYLILSNTLAKKTLERTDFSALIQPKRKHYTILIGERVQIPFKIQNKGRASWSSQEKNPCLFSYHLLDGKGEVLRYDNRRFSLPRRVIPGQTVEMLITVRSPLDEGKYILEFDLLREGIAWFKDYGSQTSRVTLLVKEKRWPEDEYKLGLDYGKFTKFDSDIPELNKMLKLIRITLEHNEVEYEGKTGKIYGFSAGKDYPQIWLRDASTIIPASRYFYGKPHLCSWLEEHLIFQKENGSLEDWIDSRGSSDKNTTETDQEASAIQAAFQVCELVGPQWLEKAVQGEKIISRLERALEFVLRSRLNEKYGLLAGAHTADWGDVDMVDEDQKAVYVDERTHWTADIYDQSMFCLACQNLAEMFEALGQREKSAFWMRQSESIKKNTNKWLWEKDRGFYKVHLHLDSLCHDFDEDNIFAMGGNAMAILSGIADAEKSRPIIKQALDRQKSFGVSTISGTLLPPYPKNFFKHPLVDDPFEYQNGGQWDWFGARLVYAMFEQGFSRTAKEKLIEILQKNLANRGFFEWDNREGIGLGSDYYAGSAGSLGKAVFEGYLGIKLGKDDLNLELKIGKDSAKIHVYLPANDIFVAYEYAFEASENKIILHYNSNFPKKGRIKVLSPWIELKKSQKELEERLEVLIDGKKTEFCLESKNEDVFVSFETDFKRHSTEIILKNSP